LLEDGTAARELMTGDDTGKSTTYPVNHVELKDAAFFESCLNAASDQDRGACLDVVAQELSSVASCP
jgi:hypothetical protein